jgi:hypothetical protein
MAAETATALVPEMLIEIECLPSGWLSVARDIAGEKERTPPCGLPHWSFDEA